MANKRIKISELPEVVYQPSGGVGSTVSISPIDHVPVAVQDPTNQTVRTSMKITTRELQRFVLQQSGDLDDPAGTLTIGRGDTNVNIPAKLTATSIACNGSMSVSGVLNVKSLSPETLAISNKLQVGSSVYPATVKDASGNPIPNGLLAANDTGKFSHPGAQTGMSLSTLVGKAPVTIASNSGKIVSIDGNGRMNFSLDAADLMTGTDAITEDETHHGNIVAVSTSGGLNPNTGVQLDDIETVVNGGLGFSDATATGQQLLVTTNTTDPDISDVQVASSDHVTLATAPVDANDAEDFTDNAGKRVVFKSPVVLGAKHTDDIDLTENAESNFPAQLGEIRWNWFNGIPTIYLAVADRGAPGSGYKTWYGVPMFGTIEGTTGGPTLTADALSHSHEDTD